MSVIHREGTLLTKQSAEHLAIHEGCLVDTLTGEVYESYRERPSLTRLPYYSDAKGECRLVHCVPPTLYKAIPLIKKENSRFITLETCANLYPKADIKLLYTEVVKLTPFIRWMNTAFVPRECLADILNCGAHNLNKKLNKLRRKRIIQYTATGLDVKGVVRVNINPAIYWVGGEKYAIREWWRKWSNAYGPWGDSLVETPLHNTLTQGVSPLHYDSSYDLDVNSAIEYKDLKKLNSPISKITELDLIDAIFYSS